MIMLTYSRLRKTTQAVEPGAGDDDDVENQYDPRTLEEMLEEMLDMFVTVNC